MVILPHETLPEKVVFLIGAVAVNSACLDLILGLLLAHKTGQPNQIDNPLFGTDTRRKVAELLALADLEPPVVQALGQMKSLLADRNQAIHGVFGRDEDGTLNYHAMRGKGLTNPDRRDEDWLIELLIRIGDASATFASYLPANREHGGEGFSEHGIH